MNMFPGIQSLLLLRCRTAHLALAAVATVAIALQERKMLLTRVHEDLCDVMQLA